MQQDERQTRRPQERWFQEDGPKRAAGAKNARRPAWNAPRWLTMLLMTVLCLLVLALVYLRDEGAPWDEDMARPIFTAQQPDMSAPVRMKAMLLASEHGPPDDPALADAWTSDVGALGAEIEKHATTLDNFRDLLEEQQSEWEPRSVLWKIEDLGGATTWRRVMLLKEAEAAHLARRGQEEFAFLSACDLAVMANLLERLDAWPSFMDRALELHERSTRTLARLLARTQLPEATLRRLQEQEFDPWVPSLKHLGAAMDGFYNFERKLLLGPQGDEPPLPLGYLPARSGSRILFKPHATLRLFAESFRELKNEIVQTAFVRSDQIEARLQRRAQSGGLLGGFNRSGLDYFATRIRPYCTLPDRVALARARHAAVLTLFAVRRFARRESRLPAKLDELVPRYLEKLPADPFSGEPLRYDSTRGLIYSVGINLKDEGGRPGEIPLNDPAEPTVQTGIGIAKPRL
jgi:hypothetical protein